jgi:hypothetical protein
MKRKKMINILKGSPPQKIYGKLRDMTNERLYELLEQNESLDIVVLTYICSEVLRRMIKKKEEDL